MKHLRKISVLILALMMVLTMGASVFAATGPDNTNGNFGPKGTGQSTGGTYVPGSEHFTTAIESSTFNVHFEKKDSNANLPKTKFTYSIANGAAVPASSDPKETPEIFAGVTGGATLAATATDAWDSPNASVEDDTIGINFDKTKFTKPGIYRYVLTEAEMTAEQANIDIKDGDKNGAHPENTLYLDVYVSNVSDELSVVAAVLSTKSDAPELTDESGTVPGTLETSHYEKIDGFYNHFETYQVVLKKTVTGSMGDKNEFFPFKLNLGYEEGTDNNTTITGVIVNAAKSDATAADTYTINSASEYTDITIKHGGTVTISGLPKMTVIKLMETVDAGERYNITSAVTDMDDSAARTAEDGTHTETAYVTKGTVKGADATNANIEYTNNRTSISPTNVVMRYAPYLFILGGAALLLVVSRRRKAEQE